MDAKTNKESGIRTLWKNKIVRGWVFLLALMLFTAFGVPLFFWLFIPFKGQEHTSFFRFYDSLFGRDNDFWLAWVIVFIPFVFRQVARTIKEG